MPQLLGIVSPCLFYLHHDKELSVHQETECVVLTGEFSDQLALYLMYPMGIYLVPTSVISQKQLFALQFSAHKALHVGK